MKPKNFPARKLARQIAADVRNYAGGDAVETAAQVYAEDVQHPTGAMADARNTRTKKRRAGA